MTPTAKNPNRVAAGVRNRRLRGPLSAAGRERLRQAAMANRPWERSTGPQTAAGKAVSAANGRGRQAGAVSLRAVRAELRAVRRLLADLADAARRLDGVARAAEGPAAGPGRPHLTVAGGGGYTAGRFSRPPPTADERPRPACVAG